MKLLTPCELGFPEKFSDGWRANQEDALQHLLQSRKRVKALSAPTGFGKTAVYVAYALLTNTPTAVVTESRGLQDQLMDDFSGVGMVDLRGRRNYSCEVRDTCEEGYASRCPYKGSVACPASQAEMRAASSMLVVTNYAKWTKTMGAGCLEHIQQVVFDEAHFAPEAIANEMQVILHDREIGELGLQFPDDAENFASWKMWIARAREIADTIYCDTKELVRLGEYRLVKKLLHYRNLCGRLARVATARPENWVVDDIEKGFQFDPVRPGRYGEAVLLLHLPSVLFVSATLRPKTLWLTGVPSDAFEFHEYPSDFPKERCPVYFIPTDFVDVKHPDNSHLWLKLDQIAARRTDRKGIVHTISYKRRDEAQRFSRFAHAMMVNRQGEASTDAVEAFKAAPPGTILVSPSVGGGFDFPGSDCEWQFVCKIPFPDGRSKILKARQEDDKEYGPYLAMNSLVQMFGRGMRRKDDQCEGFITDRHLEWFLPKFGHLAPQSFHKFFKRVETVPAPPPKL